MNYESSIRWYHWLIGIGLALVVLLIGLLSFAWWALLAPLHGSIEPVSFQVEDGQHTATIVGNLADGGFIRSSLALRVYLRLSRQSIKAGSYSLSKAGSSIDNVKPLLNGAVAERQVTIPEGLRLSEVAQRLETNGIIPAADLLGAAHYRPSLVTLPDRYNLKADTFLEGFLFPDTYRFAASATADEIIERLMTTYLERTTDLAVDYDTLILASIIEREAKFDVDRPLIASVYRNRLELAMPLQADPTVQYAAANARHGCSDDPASCRYDLVDSADGVPSRSPAQRDEGGLRHSEALDEGWWPPLAASDTITLDSPYNTYQQTGLPPRPIANPGLKSIEAAVKPATTDFLYFITDKQGRAHFAKTLAEHNANVAKYLSQ